MMRAMDPFLPDDTKLDAIRELLPSLGSGIRLDTTVAGPFPAETDRAIRQLATMVRAVSWYTASGTTARTAA